MPSPGQTQPRLEQSSEGIRWCGIGASDEERPVLPILLGWLVSHHNDGTLFFSPPSNPVCPFSPHLCVGFPTSWGSRDPWSKPKATMEQEDPTIDSTPPPPCATFSKTEGNSANTTIQRVEGRSIPNVERKKNEDATHPSQYQNVRRYQHDRGKENERKNTSTHKVQTRRRSARSKRCRQALSSKPDED